MFIRTLPFYTVWVLSIAAALAPLAPLFGIPVSERLFVESGAQVRKFNALR